MLHKVLLNSAVDANYIDLIKSVSFTILYGIVIYVKGNAKDFVEECQKESKFFAQQGYHQHKNLATFLLGVIAIAAGVIGTAI